MASRRQLNRIAFVDWFMVPPWVADTGGPSNWLTSHLTDGRSQFYVSPSWPCVKVNSRLRDRKSNRRMDRGPDWKECRLEQGSYWHPASDHHSARLTP